jgi:steroid delta-isomerase-like uncharacterized protein
MPVEQNKATILAYAEAFSRGDFDAVAALCTPDVRIQGVLGAGGLDVAMPVWRDLHHAFALHLKIEEMVAEGDTVAVRFTESGTSRNSFRGGPVTGRAYSVVAMEWFKMREGKIAQRWGARDSATIFSQMGLQ